MTTNDDHWPIYCELCLANLHDDCDGPTEWCECICPTLWEDERE